MSEFGVVFVGVGVGVVGCGVVFTAVVVVAVAIVVWLWFAVSPYGAGTRSRGLGRSKGRVWPLDATSPGEFWPLLSGATGSRHSCEKPKHPRPRLRSGAERTYVVYDAHRRQVIPRAPLFNGQRPRCCT